MTEFSTTGRRRYLAALLAGYLALAGGVLAARSKPPTGWELDIYAATPTAFWAGAAVAVVAAALVALHAPRASPPFRLALVLGPLAVVAVVGLPLLRGYHFFGPGDAMSYLGWTRLMAEERLDPTAFLYPGIESVAVVLNRTTGLSLRRALMAVPPLFVGAFVAFTALTVERISDGRKGVAVGAFLALLLLPVNNVHTYLIPYPTSAAIFLSPLVFYLLFRYVGDRGTLVRVGRRSLGTPAGALLALSGIALVLYHPQMGANVVLVLGAVLAVQAVARLLGWFDGTAAADHRAVGVQAAIVGGFFLLWAPRFDRAQGAIGGLVEGLLAGQPAGDEIATKSSSLTELGTGLGELFLKLFAVSAVLSVIAGLVWLALVSGRLDRRPDRNAMLTYLGAGFVPVVGLFGLFYAASVTVQPFRYLGFMMVFVTIVVAVAAADGLLSLPRLDPGTQKAFAAGAFVLLLAPQMAMFFVSPYMYQPSSHVAEQSVDGYGVAFEHRDPAVEFAGVRSGPRRYVDARYGTTYTDQTPGGKVFEGKEAQIPFAAFGANMTEYFDSCRYVPVTESDYDREVTLYEGLRYQGEDFRELTATPGINRVQSNGEFRLYAVDPDGSCGA